MRPAKIAQWVFVGLGATWGGILAGGGQNWFTEAFTWVMVALIWFIGIVGAVFVVLWVLKMLGVIANLPWTLERKLKDQP